MLPAAIPCRGKEGPDEAYLPAEQQETRQDARVSRAHENQRGAQRSQAPSGKGAQAFDSETLRFLKRQLRCD